MPLLKGHSKKVVSQNISEFHTGKTYAHTLKKFGKNKANKQAVAVALSTARKYAGGGYARKAEGGDDLEEQKQQAIGIHPVDPDAPPAPTPAPKAPPPPPPMSEADLTKAYLKSLTGTETGQAGTPLKKVTSGMAQGLVDWVKTPGKLMEGPTQVQPETPGEWSDLDEQKQQWANDSYAKEMTDFGAGTATGMIGMARMPGMVPPGAIGAGGGNFLGKYFGKYWHPYDLDPAEVKKAKLVKTNNETGGSNPGGVYQMPDGHPVYIKQFEGENAIERTYNEKLANELLHLAGVPVADVRMTQLNGKPAIASYMVPAKELNTVHPDNYEHLTGLREHYPAHLWTGNYDFVGNGKNNMMVMDNGQTVHIDPGGALRYRAQGKLKGPDMWGPDVKHFDLDKNPDLGDVMEGHLYDPGMQASAKRVADITDEQIHGLVQKYGPINKTEKPKLEETLKARRDGVAKLYGLDKKGPPEVPEAPPPPAPTTAKPDEKKKGFAWNGMMLTPPADMAQVVLKTAGSYAGKFAHLESQYGKEYADAVLKAYNDIFANEYKAMERKAAQQHHEPAEYAMGDDEVPPDLTSEDFYADHYSPAIKHKPNPWWDSVPPLGNDPGGYSNTIKDYKKAFDAADKGKPSVFKKIDLSNWDHPFAHKLVKPKLSEVPEWLAKKLGFGTDFQVIRGGSHQQVDYPPILDDPHNKKNSSYPDEHALYFYVDDEVHSPESYGVKAKPYVMRADKAYEAYLPRLRGYAGNPIDGAGYSSDIFKKVIDAGHQAKADVLILHGISDSGGANQTQILVLNQKGTLRAVNAKFNPKDLFNENAAKPMYGIIGGIPFAYDTLKRMGDDGKDKDKKMAKGGKVPPRTTLEVKRYNAGKIMIGAKEKAHRTVKKYAKGGKTPFEPKDHDFINFKKGGMIDSDIPGRSDYIPMKVSTGAYVLPADIPSALGQGNSKAGKVILDKMFTAGPYGLPLGKKGGKGTSGTKMSKIGFKDGGKIKAEKALPQDHQLGMAVPKGGSMCANCKYLASPTTCGNDGFVKWNGSDKLPNPANSYCCDLYDIRAMKKADGGPTEQNGNDDDHVPIIAAGGEYIIHPETVAHLGNGNMDHGHKILDKFVLHTRKEHIKTLKGLKPPK